MGAEKSDKKLKRELGLLSIFCIASGAMISSGLFVLPGLAYSKAGPAIIISYAIASLLIIPAVFSKAELATAMPKAGGTYFFIDRSMGPLMGTIGGFAAWFSLAFKSAFALVGIGIFSVLINPILDNDLITKLVAISFCILFAIINIRGVKHSGKTQILLVLGLLSLLVFYVIIGLFFFKVSNFESPIPFSLTSTLSTVGLIFVSYGGLTKVCSVAEECKNPGRNIPLGLFLSWGLISLLYIAVIAITIGITQPGQMLGSENLRPISLGASNMLGAVGAALMGVAAIFAFISTANAGILAASRDPMAMGKDQLLPNVFAKLSKKGTPIFSIIFTTCFMIFIILFLDLERLVKTASILKMILFILVMLALIVMRESKIRNYRPKFKSPLYPWVQIFGIIGLVFIVVEMSLKDLYPVFIVAGFLGFSGIWYLVFARDKIWREYSLLHIVERLTDQKSTGHLVDEELREILIERDKLEEERFEKLINECEIIDLYKYMRPDKFTMLIASKLGERLKLHPKKLYKLLLKREKDSNVVVHPGVAIVSHMIKGRDKFDMIFVRSRMGIFLSDDVDPVHAFFIIVSSPDKKSFYMHSLMWIIQIATEDFEKKWIAAKTDEELREIILKSWKKNVSI
jgi:APA family basic amino acid/polyamine antiporter